MPPLHPPGYGHGFECMPGKIEINANGTRLRFLSVFCSHLFEKLRMSIIFIEKAGEIVSKLALRIKLRYFLYPE